MGYRRSGPPIVLPQPAPPRCLVPPVRSFPLQFVLPVSRASRRPRRVHVVPVVGPSLVPWCPRPLAPSHPPREQLLAAVLVGAGSWWCPGRRPIPSSLFLTSSPRAVIVVVVVAVVVPAPSRHPHPSRSPFPPREQFLAAAVGDAVVVRGGGRRRRGSRVVVSELKSVNNENKVS
jgi:hypothetical protein